MNKAEENTRIVMSKLMPVATSMSVRRMGNWGILFNNVDGIDEAWVVNDYFMVRWTDYGDFYFNREFPYYYEDGSWRENGLTVANNRETETRILASVDLLHERLNSLYPKTSEQIEQIADTVGIPPEDVNPGNFIRLRLPFGNLYNLLYYAGEKQRRKRCRVIIKPNPFPQREVDNNRIVLESTYKEGVGIILQIPDHMKQLIPDYDMGKFYGIVENEKYNRNTIAPGQLYECAFEGFPKVNDDNFYDALNVNFVIPRKRIYIGTEIMVHYARAGFLMGGETKADVVNSEFYTDGKDILRVPFLQFCDQPIDKAYYDIPPIMLDCDTLFNLLELYRGFDYIDFNINPNEFMPVLIEGVKPNRDYPTIQVALSTLGESVGDIC